MLIFNKEALHPVTHCARSYCFPRLTRGASFELGTTSVSFGLLGPRWMLRTKFIYICTRHFSHNAESSVPWSRAIILKWWMPGCFTHKSLGYYEAVKIRNNYVFATAEIGKFAKSSTEKLTAETRCRKTLDEITSWWENIAMKFPRLPLPLIFMLKVVKCESGGKNIARLRRALQRGWLCVRKVDTRVSTE